MDAAVEAIGIVGKTFPLPLPAEGNDELNKKAVTETLFSIVTDVKVKTKVCFIILRGYGFSLLY